MTRHIVYGLGGYCADCDPSHSHPLHNIVEDYETPDPPRPPLDTTGALATLLAVMGVATVEDAANAVGLTPNDLIHEAQAWAVASENNA